MEWINRVLGRKQQQQQQPLADKTNAAVGNPSDAALAAPASTGGIGGLPTRTSRAGESGGAAAALSAMTTAAASAIAVPAFVLPSTSAPGADDVSKSIPPAASLNVSSCCPQEKWAYERCFQRWYTSEYLTGKSRELTACAAQFDVYRACVMAYYETNDPDMLVAAGGTSDRLLVQEGATAFASRYAKSPAVVNTPAAAPEATRAAK